jgi:hypothetical protein
MVISEEVTTYNTGLEAQVDRMGKDRWPHTVWNYKPAGHIIRGRIGML